MANDSPTPGPLPTEVKTLRQWATEYPDHKWREVITGKTYTGTELIAAFETGDLYEIEDDNDFDWPYIYGVGTDWDDEEGNDITGLYDCNRHDGDPSDPSTCSFADAT